MSSRGSVPESWGQWLRARVLPSVIWRRLLRRRHDGELSRPAFKFLRRSITVMRANRVLHSYNENGLHRLGRIWLDSDSRAEPWHTAAFQNCASAVFYNRPDAADSQSASASRNIGSCTRCSEPLASMAPVESRCTHRRSSMVAWLCESHRSATAGMGSCASGICDVVCLYK